MKRKQESIASFFAKHLNKESGDKSNPTPSSIPSQNDEKESKTNLIGFIFEFSSPFLFDGFIEFIGCLIYLFW